MVINKEIPDELKEDFKHSKVEFKTSKFEEYLIQDMYLYNEDSKIKLNRDVTQDLLNEIEMFLEQKRQIKYACKGGTRSGKSLAMLRINNLILNHAGKDFNQEVEKMVCGNQIEYRQALLNAEFGDVFLVDENFFTRSGLGANIEAMQLRDFNAIIAKENIHTIFINPEQFVNVGAFLGFSTYGRDDKNWLSRLLVYKFTGASNFLIGYIVIDIGKLFWENGCFIYKFTTGCNNLARVKYSDIPERFIKHSQCIPKDYDKSKIDDSTKVCPFYNVCAHGLCKYEHKKDNWIMDERKGGLDWRTKERYILALKLLLELMNSIDTQKMTIKLKVKNKAGLKDRVKIKMHKYSNAKLGIGEQDDLNNLIINNCDLNTLVETLLVLENSELTDKFLSLEDEGAKLLRELYNEMKQEHDEIKSKETEQDIKNKNLTI